MAKPPEVRIKVPDMDRLLLLTESQLKVWLYYKRRMGADGKAWGKASTIAAACGFTKPTSPQAVKNTRAWLVKNGWLTPNGRSAKGLPMFLAVIPRLPPEAPAEVPEGNPQITGRGIHGLPQGSSGDYTEVPTLEVATLKDSALSSGRKEGRNSSVSSNPEIEDQPKCGFDAEDEEEKQQRQPLPKWAVEIEAAWVEGGGRAFDAADVEALAHMFETGAHASEELIAYIEDTFKCPKTAKVAWRDFSYWAHSMSLDAEPSTQRNIDAWRRATKAKADSATKPTNPNCTRCKGSTYGSPTFENDKPYCADCMKFPTYR